MTEYCYYIPLLGFYLDKTEILVSISALLTVAVLSFTLFASTYSNFLHSSKTAWVNWHYSSPPRDYWRILAEDSRYGAQRRAWSGNLSFWSLCSAIVSLILAIKYCNWYWLIPFKISVVLLIVAFVIFIREGIPRCIRKLSPVLRLRAPLGGNVRQLWEAQLRNEDPNHLRDHWWHYDDNLGDC